MRESRRLVFVLPPPAVPANRLGAAQHPGSPAVFCLFICRWTSALSGLWRVRCKSWKTALRKSGLLLGRPGASSVSYTTSVCVKRTLSIVSFFILLSINLEIIGSLMHADKDLFIRGYFFFVQRAYIYLPKYLWPQFGIRS